MDGRSVGFAKPDDAANRPILAQCKVAAADLSRHTRGM